MNGRIERQTPRDEFLIAMFNDDPRLVAMFREAERKRFNWRPVLGGLIALGISAACWAGFIYAVIAAYHWWK
jgi:hypothetical protein